jgi:hypothetical protein
MPFGGSVHEDAGAAVLDYPDKLVTLDMTGWGARPWVESWAIEFHGTEGTLQVGLQPPWYRLYQRRPQARLCRRLARLGGGWRFRRGQLVSGRCELPGRNAGTARPRTQLGHEPAAVARRSPCRRHGPGRDLPLRTRGRGGSHRRRGRCHVVESLMRVRRVSQLKSCGGDDFAPRLHGRCPEGSVRSC